jgi:ubiquinone/menaquinone biosynthesis C-methylase UbiE
MSAKPIAEVRERALAPVRGTALELGFGSGLSVAFYGDRVSRLLFVEPSETARRLARKRIAGAPFPVELVGLDGEKLDLPDASVDWAVTAWTLCTIPRPEAALAEIARVLKPGGAYAFAEHGLSPDPGVARWQHRLNGIQKFVGGGCHLNRPIDRLIESAPLRIQSLERDYIAGPRTHSYMYVGTAVKAGQAAVEAE